MSLKKQQWRFDDNYSSCKWYNETKENYWKYAALDKLIHWKIKIAFLRMANSIALGLTGN